MKKISAVIIEEDVILEYPRQTFDKALIGKGYWIRFTCPIVYIDGLMYDSMVFCYPHDLFLEWCINNPTRESCIKGSESWENVGRYSMPVPSVKQLRMLIRMFEVS